MDSRTCTKCDTVKPINQFRHIKGKPMFVCLECHYKYQKEYTRQNAARIKAREQQYRKDHADEMKQKREAGRDKMREYQKQHYAANRESILERQKAHNKKPETRAKERERRKEYCQRPDVKEKLAEYQERYYHSKGRKKQNEYKFKRRAEDPGFKLRCNLAIRARKVLKGEQKSAHMMDLIGCSLETLRVHLEYRFTPEMNWDNYGTYWHVDHIIPCASFDLTKEEDQRRCFHVSNLQPLEAKENMRKGARVETIPDDKKYEIKADPKVAAEVWDYLVSLVPVQ